MVKKSNSEVKKRNICFHLSYLPLSVFSLVALKRHINQQQACALQFFLSIKVISESFEALLCQERRVKRGEIDGWAARARHQRKVKARMSLLLDAVTGGDSQRTLGCLT